MGYGATAPLVLGALVRSLPDWPLPWNRGGGGSLFGALASPGRPTHPAIANKFFLRGKTNFTQEAGNLRPIFGISLLASQPPPPPTPPMPLSPDIET